MHNDPEVPDDDEEELKELIELALKQNLKEKKQFKRRVDLTRRLATILSEYLDSYIMLGFDFSGRHVEIKAADTPQKVEALNSFLLKYFAAESQSIKGTSHGQDEVL
jgi:hypothetical protein|tara:strand:- start:1459 stop:1779 length:321 start_codon:yes stop_codon:yes gene_type:complete